MIFNPAEWLAVSALHEQVRHLPRSQWRDALSHHSASDSVKAQVLHLLNAQDRGAGDWLQALATIDFTETDESREDSDLSGHRLGAVRLQRKLASGGMGEVYLGQRRGPGFTQAVAVKIMHAHLDDEFARRFRTETQILSQIQHPNIAHLIDAGLWRNKRPYLVLEYVDGLPIHEHCIRNRLSLQARIELIIQVCEAVDTAHRHLILHRDLKPGNILVDNEGTVKLLDFGIAKLLQGEEVVQHKHNTALMTREYASPEQLQNKPLGVASDVFSLGLIVHELLTGTHPYRLDNPVLREQDLLQGRFVHPSRAAQQHAVRHPPLSASPRQFKGDLQRILYKCLSPQPDERYPAVRILAQDLRRFLRNQPVSATRPSLGYLLKKLATRHKIAAWSLLVAVLGVTSGLVLAIHQANVALDQRNLALRAQQKSEAISDFFIEILKSPRPENTRGQSVTAVQVLDNAQAKLAGLNIDDEETRRLLFGVLAESYVQLGQAETAAEVMQQATAGCRPPRSIRCAEALSYQGYVSSKLGRVASSAELIAQGEAYLRQHLADPTALNALLDSLLRSIEVYFRNGDDATALRSATEAQLLYFFLAPPDPARMANIHQSIGLVMMNLKAYAQAEAHLLKAVDAYTELLGPDDLKVASLYNNTAVMYQVQRKMRPAIEYMRKSMRIHDRVLQVKNTQVATNHRNLARFHRYLGEIDEALSEYRLARQIVIDWEGPNNPSLTVIHLEMADLHLLNGDAAAAQPLWSAAAAVFDNEAQRVYQCYHHLLAADLAVARNDISASEDAQSAYHQCMQDIKYPVPEFEHRLKFIQAQVLAHQHRIDAALPLGEQALMHFSDAAHMDRSEAQRIRNAIQNWSPVPGN